MPDLFSDNNGVLFNNFNIKDARELAQTESRHTLIRLSRLIDQGGIPGGKFDKAHFQEIHKFLFSQVYPWAGETRAGRKFQGHKETYTTGNKEIMVYAPFTELDKRFGAVADQLQKENYLKGLPLDKFVQRAAFYLDQYNHIHPFREGNGRTMQAVISQLGHEAGYSIDFFAMNQISDYNNARDLGILRVGAGEQNLTPLTELLRLITSPVKTKEAEQIRNTPAAPTPPLSEELLKLDARRDFDASGIRMLEMIPIFPKLDTPAGFQLKLNEVKFDVQKIERHKPLFDKVITAILTHPGIKPGSPDDRDTRRFQTAVLQLEKIAQRQTVGEETKLKPQRPKLF